MKYNELPSLISAYAHNDDYFEGTSSWADIQNTLNKRGQESWHDSIFRSQYTLLRWINLIQLWQEYWCGDDHPLISLLDCDELAHNIDEINDHCIAVKDDKYIKMLEFWLELKKENQESFCSK